MPHWHAVVTISLPITTHSLLNRAYYAILAALRCHRHCSSLSSMSVADSSSLLPSQNITCHDKAQTYRRCRSMSGSISELSGIHLSVDHAFPILSAHVLRRRSDDISPRPTYVMMLSGSSSIAESLLSRLPLPIITHPPGSLPTFTATPLSLDTTTLRAGCSQRSLRPSRLVGTFLPSTELTPDTADTSFQCSHIGFFATTLFRPHALSPSHDPLIPSTLPSQPSLFTHHREIQ